MRRCALTTGCAERRAVPSAFRGAKKTPGEKAGVVGRPGPPKKQRTGAMTHASSSFRGASASERTRNPEHLDKVLRVALDSGPTASRCPGMTEKMHGL